MPINSIYYLQRIVLAASFFIFMCAVFTGCGKSDKLVDLSEEETIALVESIQGNFAEEGWTYTGHEVVDPDKENDTETVLISYDVKGDPKDLLKKNTTEKPIHDSIYEQAEHINVKIAVKLSVYDKENDTIGSNIESIRWYVGDTEANAWIREQNKDMQ